MKKKKWLVPAVILLLALTGICVGKLIEDSRGIVVTQYADDTGSQAMFYTIEAEGKLYVVDGGWTGNAEQVRKVIRRKGGEVSGWILTHPHPDHMGAFNEIYQNPQGIVIDEIYTVEMDYALYQQYAQEWDDFATFDTFCSITEDASNVTFLHEGDTLSFPGMELTVFNAYDDTTLSYSIDLANEGSLMFRISGEQESMLFCSDVYGEVFCSKIMDRYGDALKSTYLQMGHHGNNSVTEEFISLVSPQSAFFDAPQWLVEGENYDTRENIDFVESKGIKVYTYITVPNRIEIR